MRRGGPDVHVAEHQTAETPSEFEPDPRHLGLVFPAGAIRDSEVHRAGNAKGRVKVETNLNHI